ncbi:methionyl-tRNA formyltransferase, partial [candidate division KSB1 bacterium]|nr:methionyl-tRNA formyltransferase [candidate division KSB1 bacterium]
MKIVFMGTPDFAVPTLKTLLDSKHEVQAVVTAPDKPAGRGKKMSHSAIKKVALDHDLFVLQPEDLQDPHFVDQLNRFKADLFIVVAFRILPYEVFTLPSKGTINLHASLLPKYRGAAPINWALIRGESETGVTTFFIDRQIDTGQWLMQKRIDIDPNITAGELYEQLKALGSDLVLQTIEGLESNTLQPKSQIGEVTKAPKINRELGFLEWQKPAPELHNLIRGLSPVPGCTTLFRDQV